MDATVKALGGSAPAQSKDITFFQTPDIAENGAVVPVGVTSAIPKTESIAILVEKNPEHAGRGVRHSRRAPSRRCRRASRWARARNVYALVKADGKFYVAEQGNQGNPRRVRRLTWQIRCEFAPTSSATRPR